MNMPLLPVQHDTRFDSLFYSSITFIFILQMGPRFFTKMNYMKSGKYMRLDSLLSARLNIDEKLVKVQSLI